MQNLLIKCDTVQLHVDVYIGQNTTIQLYKSEHTWNFLSK